MYFSPKFTLGTFQRSVRNFCPKIIRNEGKSVRKVSEFTCLSQSVLGKTVPEVSSTALGLRPRAVLETSGTVFPNTDRPRPVNNIFIYF